MNYLALVILACSLSWTTAHAQEVTPSTTAYVNLLPPLVGNYGAGAKLKYYKADIALRIQAENRGIVEHHAPLIRDQLIQLFTQQTDENMNSSEGKEALRKAALLQVQNALQQEEGLILIDDLLFNNFIVQP